MMTLNNTLFRELFEKAEKKLPRMESVVSIIPPYKCIHKHLQRMNVFQEKTKKMVGFDNLSFATLTNYILTSGYPDFVVTVTQRAIGIGNNEQQNVVYREVIEARVYSPPMPTDRAPSLFFSRLSLRMSPVVPVRTVAAQRVWLQPSVSTFDPPLRQGLERLAQELNAATWRTRTGSLLPFNILASPLAAAARGIDMRSGFRLVPFCSVWYGTARYCTARHGTARHAASRHAVPCRAVRTPRYVRPDLQLRGAI
ncbi:hypothetical protein G5I_10983 [Acromyrmex echinatior]|uniref:Uncharacterized protein n=1 Tax=Acromyrmex echinatior TaxID=103372 RepID=F4WYD3_ACREC|nr:hypothetical protein G5I_10983 [Acromyrmex echinatior]